MGEQFAFHSEYCSLSKVLLIVTSCHPPLSDLTSITPSVTVLLYISLITIHHFVTISNLLSVAGFHIQSCPPLVTSYKNLVTLAHSILLFHKGLTIYGNLLGFFPFTFNWFPISTITLSLCHSPPQSSFQCDPVAHLATQGIILLF